MFITFVSNLRRLGGLKVPAQRAVQPWHARCCPVHSDGQAGHSHAILGQLLDEIVSKSRS